MPSTESITYSFVQFYYSKLHEDPTKLYQIYTTNAKLTHTKIPLLNEPNIVNKLIEIESFNSEPEIQKFYSTSPFKNSKIRVSSIDSQSALDNESIFISVIGELALHDDSPVYRFTQSFLLTPGKVANSYYIANDIFRLIPDDDFELNQDEKEEDHIEEEETKEGIKEEVTEEVKEEHKQNGVKEEEKEQVEEEPKVTDEPIEPRTKVEASPAVNLDKDEEKPETNIETKGEEKSRDVKQQQVRGSSKDLTKAEIKEEGKKETLKENEPGKEKSSEATPTPTAPSAPTAPTAPTAPAAPLSWAQISSTNSSKPVTTVKPKLSQQPKKSESPQPQSQPDNKQAKALNNATNGQSPKPQTQRKRAERLHPVLIQGIEDLKAAEIKVGLEKEFGRTTKVEPRGHFALADFETAESQQLALKKKSLKILNSTIIIEPKTSRYEFNDKKKTSGTNTNGNRSNKPKQNSGTQQKKKVVKQSA